MCLAQGHRHKAVTPMRLEPATFRSRAKHSTNEPLSSPFTFCFCFSVNMEAETRKCGELFSSREEYAMDCCKSHLHNYLAICSSCTYDERQKKRSTYYAFTQIRNENCTHSKETTDCRNSILTYNKGLLFKERIC